MKLNRMITAAVLAALVGAGTAAADDKQVGDKGFAAPGKSGEQATVITEPSQLLNKLYFITQFDIRASELAKQRSQNEDVKELAGDIIKHQTKLEKKIVEVGRELGIELTPPLAAGVKTDTTTTGSTKQGSGTNVQGSFDVNAKRQEALDKLNRLQSLSGAEFDREYVNAMNMCAEKTSSFLQPTWKALKDKDDDTSDKLEDVVDAAIDNAKDHKEDIADVQKEIGKVEKK